MDDPSRANSEEMEAPQYAYSPRASLVCPKCGNLRSFPLIGIEHHTLAYAGVCGAALEPGLWCDAMMHLEVTSHLWPTA